MVRVAVLDTDDLGADARAAIINLCVEAHNEPDFERLFDYIPTGGRHFLAHHDGEIAGHAVVTTRWLHAANSRLRTAYVDAVATLPTLQGRGIATAVMHELARNIDDHDIGCLQTDSPAFYERLGWQRWRGPLTGRTPSGVVPTPDEQGVMILRLPRTPELDLDTALSIETDGGRIW